MSMPSLAQALTAGAQHLGDSAKAALLSRLDFASLLDQRGRLLQVHTALPALALVPERMVMREAVGQPFELVLDCVSTSTAFELKLLIGEQISLSLLQPDGTYKPRHGYVFEAAQLGSDGGLARYRVVMRPWLSFLAYRRDSFVYQDKTALQIIEDVFADHPQAKYRLEVTDELRVRSLCSQFRESDLAFVARLLAEEGLSYHFEHDAEGDVASASGALHTLVITDRQAPRPDLGDARFTAQHVVANVAGQRDAVTAFATRRSLQANAVALGSWNYRQLAGTSAELTSALSLGEIPTLELYDGSGAYRYEHPAHAERTAELALAALELDVKRFEGQGSTRHFEAGRTFSLIDHPLYGANTTAFNDVGALLASHQRADNAFTLLAVEHHASNNLGTEAAQLLGSTDLERGTYRNHFHAAPAAAPVVPRFVRKPTAPGAQTALVVGLSGEPLTTDRDHRVKVQFPWQRGSAPLAGGLSHEGSPDTEGNAPGDERSGTWVRVAGPSAGANWGAVFTPRIGCEVLVDFIEGDVDRPIIVGALYNGADAPPFAAGVDAGVNHPGVISGLHTPSLDQSGYNQWVMDDATGQLRMRLLSSATAAELSLGHLIQQGANTANRGSWRGSGFEANTQAWGTLRAAKGVLVSTTARAGTYGSAESTQMDAAEAVAQLKAAKDLAGRLSDAAKAGNAHGLHSADAGQAVEKFLASIDPAKDGKHAASVNGQEARKASAGSRALADPVEAFAKPVVVLDTPSTQAWASDASIASFAGQDLSVISQGDLHETAAHTHATVAGQTASFYTHNGGIKTYAANGPMSLRAHTDELQILADKDVTVISVNGEIHISAQSKIEIIGADSSIVLDGGNITFTTPGTWAAKASATGMLGGASAGAAAVSLPESKPVEAMAALNEVATLEVVSELDEGSANDGSRTTTRKAMRYDHTYEFKVKEYASKAPVSPSSVQWEAIAHLADGSNKPVAMKAQGDHAKLTVDDIELCGTDIEVRAFIQAKGSGGSTTVPVHNRFRWFDARAIADQAAQRAAQPWRIDQGHSSLCGMAALFYLMAQAHPADYQRLAKGLHRTGEYKIGSYTIKPNSQVADRMYELRPSSAPFQDLKIWEVDWITLATTRSGESMLAFDGLGTGSSDQLKSVNWPGMMAELTQKVAGFSHAEAIDTGGVAMLIKKSWIGKIHDQYSDSDIADLLTIDRLYQSGRKIMLMVDADILSDGVSYSVAEVFTDSHWIVYEGDLKLFDKDGRVTSDPSAATNVQFKAYSWGTDPNTGKKIQFSSGVAIDSPDVAPFLANGISTACWKSNYYGFIEAN